MEALLQNSRAVLVNPTLTRDQHLRYHNHLKALSKARTAKSSSFNSSQLYLSNLEKYKKANRSVSKMFDPAVLENKSLVNRLVRIDGQRSASEHAIRHLRLS